MSQYNVVHIVIIGAGVTLFFSIVFPLLLNRNKPPEFTAHSANHHPHARFTDQREKKHHHSVDKHSQRGWGLTLVPFYSLGVFLYVFYILYKIRTKQHSSRTSSEVEPPTKGSHLPRNYVSSGTKITSYELNQLEDKLRQSEEAVEKILEKANRVIKEVYQREMEKSESDSSLSESSTDCDDSETSSCTTVSKDSFISRARITELSDQNRTRQKNLRRRRNLLRRRRAAVGVKSRAGPTDNSSSEIASSCSYTSSDDDAAFAGDAPLTDSAKRRCWKKSGEDRNDADGVGTKLDEISSNVQELGCVRPEGDEKCKADPRWLREKQELVNTAHQVMTVMDDLRAHIAEHKQNSTS